MGSCCGSAVCTATRVPSMEGSARGGKFDLGVAVVNRTLSEARSMILKRLDLWSSITTWTPATDRMNRSAPGIFRRETSTQAEGLAEAQMDSSTSDPPRDPESFAAGEEAMRCDLSPESNSSGSPFQR